MLGFHVLLIASAKFQLFVFLFTKCALTMAGAEGGQVQAGSARIARGETGTSTSPEGLL